MSFKEMMNICMYLWTCMIAGVVVAIPPGIIIFALLNWS